MWCWRCGKSRCGLLALQIKTRTVGAPLAAPNSPDKRKRAKKDSARQAAPLRLIRSPYGAWWNTGALNETFHHTISINASTCPPKALRPLGDSDNYVRGRLSLVFY